MLRWKIDRVLHLRGIKKNYTYLKALGFSHHKAHLLPSGKLYKMDVRDLYVLCRELRCTPNDLLSFEPNEQESKDKTHPLYSLQRVAQDEAPIDSLAKIMKKLSLDDLSQFVASLQGKGSNSAE